MQSESDIIYKLADEKVLHRMYVWHQIYLKEIESRHSGLHLDPKLLRNAVISYFLDLYRMKEFHDIKFADSHKRAGFTMYWLAKIKPIQLETNVNMTKALLLVNAGYAIHAGFAHLALTKNDIKDMSNDCLKTLLYMLHYRSPSPESLSFMAYLLECACSKKTP